MSSKILERLNKIIFENIPGNKNLCEVHDKKDNRTVSVNIIRVSLKLAWNIVCDGVYFYRSFRLLLQIARKELVTEPVFIFKL